MIQKQECNFIHGALTSSHQPNEYPQQGFKRNFVWRNSAISGSFADLAAQRRRAWPRMPAVCG